MKKLSIVCLAVVMAVVFGFTTANADPSAKATAQIGDLSVVDVSGSSDSIDDTPICANEDGDVIPCEDNIIGYEDGSPICGAEDWEEGDPTILCEDTIIGYTNHIGWKTLFEQDIKTPTGKDLFITVSLECGLTTDTTVMSRALAKAVAEAEAVVEVRVLVDGDPVPVNGNVDGEGNPDPDTDITFARRNQKLIAQFAGDFSGCMTTEEDGSVTVDWDCVEPETLQLILDTMQANSFNFVVPDLLAGTHPVEIQAKLSYLATGNEVIDEELGILAAEGKAAARAYLGNGSATVEVVRMIKDEDVVVDLQ